MIMKKFLLFSALFLFSSFFGVEVSAQNVFSVEDITIKPGETKKVSINFANEADQVIGFSVVMQFPAEWVTLKNLAIVNDRTNDEDKPDLSFTSLGDGKYKLWYQSSDTEQFWITGNSGAVFTFDLTAKDTAPAGESFTVEIPTLNKMFNYDMDVIDYSFSPFTITVGGAAAAETEKITLTKEYNTYVPTKALDFSGVEGIKAYYVTEVTATQATITETTTVAAGEGIIISGTPGDYEVPVATAEVAKSTTNKLATGTVAEGDYILFDGKFVPCTGGTLPDGKAYLPKAAISTSSAKALILGFGDATGINEAKAAKADGAIYSISGVRVAQPQKGVYIMNGRKVIVK